MSECTDTLDWIYEQWPEISREKLTEIAEYLEIAAEGINDEDEEE